MAFWRFTKDFCSPSRKILIIKSSLLKLSSNNSLCLSFSFSLSCYIFNFLSSFGLKICWATSEVSFSATTLWQWVILSFGILSVCWCYMFDYALLGKSFRLTLEDLWTESGRGGWLGLRLIIFGVRRSGYCAFLYWLWDDGFNNGVAAPPWLI